MKRAFACALVIPALAAAPAWATTVLYVPVKQSIDMSEHVLVGHVLSLEPDYNRDGEIVTKVSLLVEEGLKGGHRRGDVVVFHAWGGSVHGVTVETVGEARYRLGEKVLVQLEAIEGEYHTLGLSFGKWNVVREPSGRQSIVRSLSDLNLVGVSGAPVEKLPLAAMRKAVRERIAN